MTDRFMTGGTGKTGVFNSLCIRTRVVYVLKEEKIYIVSLLLGLPGFSVMHALRGLWQKKRSPQRYCGI